jgi:hypothetical protein
MTPVLVGSPYPKGLPALSSSILTASMREGLSKYLKIISAEMKLEAAFETLLRVV